MPLYPISIRRCQHIKVNGTQCASPALRNEKVCYFHMRWCIKSTEKNSNGSGEPNLTNNSHAQDPITLPVLEDANSIQVALTEVIRKLATQQFNHQTAALMLYALQTASVNIKHTSFEPEPTRVVIDQNCVEQRPLGSTAWSAEEGCEYENLVEISEADEKDSALKRLVNLLVNHPDTLEMKIKRDENGQAFLASGAAGLNQ